MFIEIPNFFLKNVEKTNKSLSTSKIKELQNKFLLDRHSTWSFIKTQKLDFWRQINVIPCFEHTSEDIKRPEIISHIGPLPIVSLF